MNRPQNPYRVSPESSETQAVVDMMKADGWDECQAANDKLNDERIERLKSKASCGNPLCGCGFIGYVKWADLIEEFGVEETDD